MKAADDLLPRVREHLAGISPAIPAVVAVSGGVDSVVLLDLLLRAGFANLAVAHFHHGLRGAAADRDAEFVGDLAAKHGLPFILGRGDTRTRAKKHKESIEEAARNLRRKFLVRAARKHGAQTVFLAHHAGDAAETVLFHLARGGGPRGLSAMRKLSLLGDSGIVLARPMLGLHRDEIEAHARRRRLGFRTDETNASPEHTRNRIRLDIFPALARAVGFDPVPPMARAAEILAAEDEWIEALVAGEALAASLDARALRTMPVARQRRLLRAWLRTQTKAEPDFATVERVRKIALSSSGPAKTNLPHGRHLRRRAGRLFIEQPRRKSAQKK